MAKKRKDSVPPTFEHHTPTNAHVSEKAVYTGTIELTLETPDGERTKLTVGIKPGIPKVRLMGAVVDTAVLMKMATGEVVSEQELKDNPLLDKIGQEGAIQLIHIAATIKAGWLQNF